MSDVIWKVLIIDDSPDDRAEVRRLLLTGSGRRYKFVEAETGRAGLGLCDDVTCVVLDYRLPDMDAPEVLAAMRHGQEMTPTPVVVMTGTAAREMTTDVLRAGAMDYLGKAWMNPESLTRAVENAVERFALQREVRERGERLRRLGDNLPENVVYQYARETDGTRRFVYLSAGIELLNGVRPDEALRDPDVLLRQIPPEHVERIRAAEARSARELSDFEIEVPMRRSDGELRWMRLKSRPHREADGRIVWDGVQTDVTERKRQEAQLRESEERLRLALEGADLGTWDLDLRADTALWNRRHASLLGIAELAAPMSFEAWRRRVHPDDLDRVMANIERARRDKTHYSDEHRLRADNSGKVRWIALYGRFHYDEAGEAVRFSGVSRDITEQREAEQQFRTLADHMSQFAWMADAKGGIYWYNRRWCEYTGTTLDEVQGWGWKKLHHPDHVDRVVKRMQQAWDTGELWEDTFPLRGADGNYRWFLSRAVPIRDDEGRILRWFGTNTDITEQRELQEALKDADRKKDEFLATLAHELRNPLAPIRNSLELLKRIRANDDLAQQARGTMERQVAQMVRLIDDLLDVSRITRNKLELKRERVELTAIAQQAVEACRPLFEKAEHRLQVALPPAPIYLDADPVRLVQVIGNLLTNACKYTEPGGQIWLRVERQGTEVALSVKDTGLGIPPDFLPRVFDLFTQVDKTLARSQGGLGIGLSLVQRLVEMHGGTVTAHSEGQGRGSEFVVRLPILVEQPKAQPIPGTDDEPPFVTARRILVVDDNRDSADSLAMLLKLFGNEVLTAYDGAEAIKQAALHRPDAILFDIGLPQVSGYDACRLIRREPWGQDILILAMTGWGQEEDKRRSQEAGFDGHLVKPVNHAELMKMLAGADARHVGKA